MQANTVVESVRHLLDRTRLSEQELASRLQQARSVDYWERLNPSLSVGRKGPSAFRESKAIGPRRRAIVLEQLRTDGYFQLDSLLPRATLGRMRECVEILRREDWPPVFGFVYDEFWQVTRVPSLVRLLSAALGTRFRQIPHVWSFYVPAKQGSAGWPPHTEGGAVSDCGNRLVIWVPLSDATLENGCIYVIPRQRISSRLETMFPSMETVNADDVRSLLQNCRAVPAREGSVLGWDFRVVHWGSASGGRSAPRVSISVEFLGAGVKPVADEEPLLDARSELPTFDQRLLVIGRAIRNYTRYEPLLIRFEELAEGLAHPAGSVPG
jgi:hypothetical protein